MEDVNFEKFYKSIGKVFCPYFNEYVFFTDKGLEHLKFKSHFNPRTIKDSAVRMRLLPIAIKILNLTTTIQGINSVMRFEHRYIHNRKETALQPVKYFEFIAVVEGMKVKVIIKQISDDRMTFLSVIPLLKEKTPPAEGDGFS